MEEGGKQTRRREKKTGENGRRYNGKGEKTKGGKKECKKKIAEEKGEKK